jgi:hypothetical protein
LKRIGLFVEFVAIKRHAGFEPQRVARAKSARLHSFGTRQIVPKFVHLLSRKI